MTQFTSKLAILGHRICKVHILVRQICDSVTWLWKPSLFTTYPWPWTRTSSSIYTAQPPISSAPDFDSFGLLPIAPTPPESLFKMSHISETTPILHHNENEEAVGNAHDVSIVQNANKYFERPLRILNIFTISTTFLTSVLATAIYIALQVGPLDNKWSQGGISGGLAVIVRDLSHFRLEEDFANAVDRQSQHLLLLYWRYSSTFPTWYQPWSISLHHSSSFRSRWSFSIITILLLTPCVRVHVGMGIKW